MTAPVQTQVDALLARLRPPMYADSLARIAASAVVLSFGRSHRLFTQGDAAENAFLIGSGVVAVTRRMPAGRDLGLGCRGEGEWLGESLAFGQGDVHLETAVAMNQVEAVAIPLDVLRSIARDDPMFTCAIGRALTAERDALYARIGDVCFGSMPSRLRHFLLDAARRWGVPDGPRRRIPMHLTHELIASYVGATRESVTTTLSQLRKQGLIETEGRRLAVSARIADEEGGQPWT